MDRNVTYGLFRVMLFNSIQFVVCFLSLEVGSLDFIKFCFVWIANFVDLEILWYQTVKIDINIERDLAYALKVKDCPQILFLRGNKILYREKGKAYCFHNRITSRHIQAPIFPSSYENNGLCRVSNCK